MNFVKKYLKTVEEKNSVLCVGLDPAIKGQREKNVMSDKNRVKFMRNIIDLVSEHTSVVKINRQYILGLTTKEIQEINERIHSKGMLSVIDHKLGDIGSTNDSALYWFREEDFDAFTFSPFAGNIEEATQKAHALDMGIIVLALMSNPEAIYQKEAKIEKQPLYEYIAKKISKYNADGCVIGATGHVKEEDIKKIRNAVGDNVIALVPGVGAQGGSAELLLKEFGDKTMVNVGRGVIYAENPEEKAKYYKELFNGQRKKQ